MNPNESFTLPLLDASLLHSGDPSKQKEFADQLRNSLVNHGFAKIINHGIPDDLVAELFAWSVKFFHLPLDVKSQIQHKPGPYPQRGWSSVGSENTAKLFKALNRGGVSTMPDSKEHFDMSAETDLDFPNKWLDEQELPGFQLFMQDFYERCRVVSRQLLSALEMAMDLPAGAITDKCRQPADELRLNRYPPIANLEATSVETTRAWPHTDLGVLTLLFQDSIGGLEIQDRSNKGRFQAIPPGSPSELVVNTSETLERWTQGKLTAGVHRVTVPQRAKEELARGVFSSVSVAERFSIPYFVKADRDASVGPLSQFLDDVAPSVAYPDMTGLEFHMKRIAEAY